MNKKQKNWLAAALLGVVSLTTSAQEEGPSKLVVHFQEGATSEFALTDIQALTFGTESFSIALTNGTNQSDLAYEDVAKLTAGKYKKYYNPHDSLHYATYSDCVACHREHQPSRLDCNNSNCHREFKYKVP